jgi:hypothetical protein
VPSRIFAADDEPDGRVRHRYFSNPRAPVIAASILHPPFNPLRFRHAAMRVSLVASGQIKLRRIDGWRKIAAVLRARAPAAA